MPNFNDLLKDANQRIKDQLTEKEKNKIRPQGEPSQVPEYLKKMGLADDKEKQPPQPPTEKENQWAEDGFSEDLKKLLAEEMKATTEPKPRKKRASSGRTWQVMTRMNAEEKAKFEKRVKKSKLSQGEFIRQACLNGKIEIIEKSPVTVDFLDELAELKAEVGRQGGMLKMLIKPNEGKRELDPEAWEDFIAAIRNLEDTKQKLAELEVKIYGNRHAQYK